MTCPACSATVPAGALKCPVCGLDLSAIGGQGGGGVATAAKVTPSVVTRPQNHSLAVVSALLGVASWIMLGLFASVPAVVTGHIALRAAQVSNNKQAKTLAMVGLISAYANIGFVVIALLLALLAAGAF